MNMDQQKPDVENQDRKESIAKKKAKQAVALVETKCTDKVLTLANKVCCVIFLIGGITRFIHVGSSTNEKGESTFNFFFLLSTFYYWAFVLLLCLGENPKEDFKPTIMVKTYFNFLDLKFNKGIYILFLSTMLCETDGAGDIIMGLVCIGIAVCNIIIGWGEAKKGLPSNPWGNKSSTGEQQSNNMDKYRVEGAVLGMAAGAAMGGMIAQGQTAIQNSQKEQEQFSPNNPYVNDQARPSNVPLNQNNIDNLQQEMTDIDTVHSQQQQKQLEEQQVRQEIPAPSQLQQQNAKDKGSMQSVELDDPYNV